MYHGKSKVKIANPCFICILAAKSNFFKSLRLFPQANQSWSSPTSRLIDEQYILKGRICRSPKRVNLRRCANFCKSCKEKPLIMSSFCSNLIVLFVRYYYYYFFFPPPISRDSLRNREKYILVICRVKELLEDVCGSDAVRRMF